jgi:hypothetical protein
MEFIKVHLNLSYIVPNEKRFIDAAYNAIYEDAINLQKYDEIQDHIDHEPAPDATINDVSEFFLEYEKEGLL